MLTTNQWALAYENGGIYVRAVNSVVLECTSSLSCPCQTCSSFKDQQRRSSYRFTFWAWHPSKAQLSKPDLRFSRSWKTPFTNLVFIDLPEHSPSFSVPWASDKRRSKKRQEFNSTATWGSSNRSHKQAAEQNTWERKLGNWEVHIWVTYFWKSMPST